VRVFYAMAERRSKEKSFPKTRLFTTEVTCRPSKKRFTEVGIVLNPFVPKAQKRTEYAELTTKNIPGF
jgi:hypothetical protein